MSYVILGRAIKSEYLALGTIFSTAGLAYLSTGGKKEVKPAPGQSIVDRVKEAVPINAASSEEEQLMASIKNYIAEAEKESKH